MRKFQQFALTQTVDGGAAGYISQTGDTAIGDVEGLERISLYLNQLVDAGTCTFDIYKSIDGTNWVHVVTHADTDFAAGANSSLEVSFSDANGMPEVVKQIKVVATAIAGGGHYSANVAGIQLENYR